jgi:hypothetical protein
MLYLLDANVLIDAARDYYPLDMVPEFWDWLRYQGELGFVKVPVETYEEVCEGRGTLPEWLDAEDVRGDLLLDKASDQDLVSRAVEQGYAPDLTDDEILTLGRDPFLVSYCLGDPASHTIVTTEVSKPGRRRANRHLPDVCATFGVACFNTFELTRRLGFRTSWRRPTDA